MRRALVVRTTVAGQTRAEVAQAEPHLVQAGPALVAAPRTLAGPGAARVVLAAGAPEEMTVPVARLETPHVPSR
jgi:hypothetical protein